MDFRDKLDAIGRIVEAIKVFRHHTGYTDGIFKSKDLDIHLKSVLLPADFKLWTSLRLTETARQL